MLRKLLMNPLIKHPFLTPFLAAVIVGMLIAAGQIRDGTGSWLLMGPLVGLTLLYPVILTLINVVLLCRRAKSEKQIWTGHMYEFITIVLGFIYTGLLILFHEIEITADWQEVLTNNQIHTPVSTADWLMIGSLGVLGICGYLLLSWVSLERMPPLVIVCGISAMYLGIIVCILWTVQVFQVDDVYSLYLCLFPLNCIIIAAKTIRMKIFEWNHLPDGNTRIYKNRYFNAGNQKLMSAGKWPLAAFLIMWPLLGILICILVLFGQQPDGIIKAWTETSDWNLSNRTAPQNIVYDEHYLCTVAAGGHKKVVKPIRLGVRNGHQVIVNRQLCAANAFEQILEEKMPELHQRIRHFYDTYGFPIAKRIHSPLTADMIYFVMKPLEWFFVGVIYFCDVKPENRIAVQYLPKIESCYYSVIK